VGRVFRDGLKFNLNFHVLYVMLSLLGNLLINSMSEILTGLYKLDGKVFRSSDTDNGFLVEVFDKASKSFLPTKEATAFELSWDGERLSEEESKTLVK
jgi:hypothetical protein